MYWTARRPERAWLPAGAGVSREKRAEDSISLRLSQSSETEIKALFERDGKGEGLAGLATGIESGLPAKPTMRSWRLMIDQALTHPRQRPLNSGRAGRAIGRKDVDQLLQKLTAADRFSGVVLHRQRRQARFSPGPTAMLTAKRKSPNKGGQFPSSVSGP